MRVKLDAEAQALLGKEELIIITEEVDDVVLLIGHMEQMGLREILDHHIPKHWNQSELSWGWTAVIWLAYILSEGDHRKVAMEIYVKGMINTLSNTTGQPIDPLYFSDDRLSRLLKHLGNKNYWEKIENELTEKTIEVFELPTEVVRCDATTVSGYHINEEGCLMQFGHSKDDPSLPQLKIMSGALDPLGMPLVTKVVSGETADDVLYIPVIEQIHDQLKKEGVLIVSDCKGSALSIRHYIVGQDNHYLSPLPLTGDTAISMEDWIKKGIEKDYAGELELCIRDNDKGESILLACGYEFERTIKIKIKNEDDENNNNEDEWKERVLVIKSISHLQQQEKGLEKRLENAIGKIISLTPKRGKGIKQTTKEDDLIEAINKILRRYKVEGLLNVEYKLEVEKEEKYVGKGRGSAQRKKQMGGST